MCEISEGPGVHVPKEQLATPVPWGRCHRKGSLSGSSLGTPEKRPAKGKSHAGLPGAGGCSDALGYQGGHTPVRDKQPLQCHRECKLFLSLMGSHVARKCVLKARPEDLEHPGHQGPHPAPPTLPPGEGPWGGVHKQALCTPTTDNSQFVCAACAGAGVLSKGLTSLGP